MPRQHDLLTCDTLTWLFEKSRLCSDGSYTTWAQQLRKGDKQVNGENEEFAHGRTLLRPPSRARLHRKGAFPHTNNLPSTREPHMNMLMIFFRESLEEDIQGLLSKHHVRAFTEMHEVTGMGEAGAAFHSLSWPGLNNMILAVRIGRVTRPLTIISLTDW
jgi:hypothetical protein